MKKTKKVVALLLCAVLLVVGSVTGTMAYLTSQDSVQNTFTVGKVAITLDEAGVNEYGQYVDVDENGDKGTTPQNDPAENRVKNNTYNLLPGKTYPKDPIVHVDASSEDCWVFVEVANGIKIFEDTNGITIENQILGNGWAKLTGEENVYYKAYQKNQTDKDLKVFANFKIANEADKVQGWNSVTNTGEAATTIKVTAYAIQSEGFENVSNAWTTVSTASQNGASN